MYKICLWNYADGEYSFMNKALIQSFRNNDINYDFINIGPTQINGAINLNINLSHQQKRHYLFKFNLLKELKDLPYDYFIFIDADTYCVNNIEIHDCIEDAPVHSFLESDCTNPNNLRKDWWGCPLPIYVNLMRDMGVVSEKIYNVNAGFWGVHRKAIDQFYNIAMSFWQYSKSKGYEFTEEAPLAYATHMMSGDINYKLQKKWFSMWASDWTGNFKDSIPEYRDWLFEDYMTSEKHVVKPSIVHAMRSKNALINMGKKI